MPAEKLSAVVMVASTEATGAVVNFGKEATTTSTTVVTGLHTTAEEAVALWAHEAATNPRWALTRV